MSKLKIIAVTGGIATGKSTVLRMLQKHNVKTIDCDAIAREVFSRSETKIVSALGPFILENGRISKQKTANLIFTNSEAKRTLERIMHRQIYLLVAKEIIFSFLCNYQTICIEIQLFFEHNLDRFFDSIVVYVDKETQIQRMSVRDGSINLKDKMRAQMDIEEKKNRGTYLIYNVDMNDTIRQLEKLNIEGTRLTTYIVLFMALLILIISK